MSIRDFVAKRCALAFLALVVGSGCDLIARPGETLVLGNRGSVFGTGGNAQQAPLPAVRVQGAGSVIVRDADVFGGGTVVERVDQQRFGVAGAGIRSDGGSVRVEQGLVRGGPVVLSVSTTPFDEPASAILAVASNVEIVGGVITGGPIVANFPDATQPVLDLAARAVDIDGGTLRITGGVFSAGARLPAAQPGARAVDPSVVGARVTAEIRGGEFNGGLSFIDSTTRIFGGSGFLLSFLSVGTSSCSEIRGGTFSGIGVSGGRVLVFGTGLRLMPLPGGQLLTGTLENGTPIQAVVALLDGGQVVLAAPRSAGCPST